MKQGQTHEIFIYHTQSVHFTRVQITTKVL